MSKSAYKISRGFVRTLVPDLQCGRIRFEMGKGRPAPISSFGAGQGDNNISRLFEDKKDQLQFHPLETGRVFFWRGCP